MAINGTAAHDEHGCALLLTSAPRGKHRVLDAESALPLLAAVPPQILTGTRSGGSVVQLVDPVDANTVNTHLRTAAAAPGPLLVYVCGQLTVDRKQRLPHLVLGRTTPDTVRYTALPWHWLAVALRHRAPGTAAVICDLVADGTAWRQISAQPGQLASGLTLYGVLAPPPPKREVAHCTYSKALAEVLRAAPTRPPLAQLHQEAAMAAGATGARELLFGAVQGPLPTRPMTTGTAAPGLAAADPSPGAYGMAAPGAGGSGAVPVEFAASGAAPQPVSAAGPTASQAGAAPGAGRAARAQLPVGGAVSSGPAGRAAPQVADSGVVTTGPLPAPGAMPSRSASRAVPEGEGCGARAAPSSPAGAVPLRTEASGTAESGTGTGPLPALGAAPRPSAAPGPSVSPPAAPDPAGARSAAPARADVRPPAPPAPRATAVPPQSRPAAVVDPHDAIREAARAGRHTEAAAIAAAWEQAALRAGGPASAEAVHWVEVRADLAMLAQDTARACELWMTSAQARLSGGQAAEDEDVITAVDRAHHCWSRVTDRNRARQLAPDLAALRRRVVGRRPDALSALQQRLHDLGAVPADGRRADERG